MLLLRYALYRTVSGLGSWLGLRISNPTRGMYAD